MNTRTRDPKKMMPSWPVLLHPAAMQVLTISIANTSHTAETKVDRRVRDMYTHKSNNLRFTSPYFYVTLTHAQTGRIFRMSAMMKL